MLQKLSNYIDSFNQTMGKVVSYGTLAMAIVTFSVVVLRYGFNIGSIAMQESITYLHAAVFLLGSAYTYQQNGHVRVDIFYRRFNRRQKAWVDILGSLLFLLPLSIFLSYYCWIYAADSWGLLETSREPGGLPFVYILKSFLVIFSMSMVLQAISDLCKQSIILSTSEQEQV